MNSSTHSGSRLESLLGIVDHRFTTVVRIWETACHVLQKRVAESFRPRKEGLGEGLLLMKAFIFTGRAVPTLLAT